MKEKDNLFYVVNPLESESKEPVSYIEEVLREKQIPVPWAKKTHLIAPWFLKYDGKIAKYDMAGLHIWRVHFPH